MKAMTCNKTLILSDFKRLLSDIEALDRQLLAIDGKKAKNAKRRIQREIDLIFNYYHFGVMHNTNLSKIKKTNNIDLIKEKLLFDILKFFKIDKLCSFIDFKLKYKL